MKKFLTVITILISFTGIAQAQTYIQLILDLSGSMYEKLESGEPKIDAARVVLTDFISELPDDNLNVGLRVYGATTGAMDGGACEDSQLTVAMQGVDKDALLGIVSTTEPKGATPIAYSLQQAVTDFQSVPAEAEKIIVLVTDGEESCAGDLQAALGSFESQGIEVDLRIVGLGLSEKAAKTFEDVGGTFENTLTTSEFSLALAEAIEVAPAPVSTLQGPIAVPTEVLGGTAFEVVWTGLDKPNGYLTIVHRNAPEGSYKEYHYISEGNPLTFTAPLTAGNYEVRYQSDSESGVFIKQPFKVLPPVVSISVPTEVSGGSIFEVVWGAPAVPQSYFTVVPRNTPEGGYQQYFYTNQGNPLEFTAPLSPGNYEVRYRSDAEAGVFAKQSFTIKSPIITISAIENVQAGSIFEVSWTGPNVSGAYLTIVPRGANEGNYGQYFYTNQGNILDFTAPDTPGDYEIRYQSDAEPGVFASFLFTVK